MASVSVIGLDLAKNVFQVHGIDTAGKVLLRRQLRRSEVIGFFKKLSPCLVGMEACATAHHWARELIKIGHTVKLMRVAERRAEFDELAVPLPNPGLVLSFAFLKADEAHAGHGPERRQRGQPWQRSTLVIVLDRSTAPHQPDLEAPLWEARPPECPQLRRRAEIEQARGDCVERYAEVKRDTERVGPIRQETQSCGP